MFYGSDVHGCVDFFFEEMFETIKWNQRVIGSSSWPYASAIKRVCISKTVHFAWRDCENFDSLT